jgi:hypothetical protein
VFKIR